MSQLKSLQLSHWYMGDSTRDALVATITSLPQLLHVDLNSDQRGVRMDFAIEPTVFGEEAAGRLWTAIGTLHSLQSLDLGNCKLNKVRAHQCFPQSLN